jgi:uncharacterized membrane protein SirB2
MKNLKIVLAILLGFSLSYIPNNYMGEKYESIALYIVLGTALIGIVWSLISKNKAK